MMLNAMSADSSENVATVETRRYSAALAVVPSALCIRKTAKENIIRKLNEDLELHNEFINNSIKELDVL